MNNEDIIRMAQEAGFVGGGCEALFRFAALVAAAEREACERRARRRVNINRTGWLAPPLTAPEESSHD